jgi:hypothetical protein
VSAEAVFDSALLERLERVREVQMVTPRRDGTPSSRPIWVVVVGGAPYVRSYRGRRGAWWRRVRDDGGGVLGVDGDELPFAAEQLREAAGELNRRISEAFEEKYGATSPGPTREMVTDAIARTTMRLSPAPGAR